MLNEVAHFRCYFFFYTLEELKRLNMLELVYLSYAPVYTLVTLFVKTYENNL